MARRFSITTAIDYTNSAPHIGHAYEKVLADVLARYHRLKGEEIFFLTGVDQHGQKVQQSAARAGVPPAEFVRDVTQKFIDLWRKLDVRYDEWAETVDERHQRVVRGILQRLFDEKQIYKDKQKGWYSVRQEQFLTDKERGPDGEFGPEWGQVEEREEENYYFKLNQHKEWLLKYLDDRRDGVIPDYRQTELHNAVEKLSGDLCISRPKSRLDWGIELPFDKDFVTYVWFDALTNYISFAGYEPGQSTFKDQPSTFQNRWPALQIIGKDILIPAHGIYWLIMLHALGFSDGEMPQLLVHGWWNIGGAKMSKSEGNAVDPSALADKYGAEALRYYLMSDIGTGKDADFSEERLIDVYNSGLANSLGNLLNRSLNMTGRFCGQMVPDSKDEIREPGSQNSFPEKMEIWTGTVKDSFKEMQPESVLFVLRLVATELNRLIEEKPPWTLAKSTDPEDQKILKAVLYTLLESLRIIAILIWPILPGAAHRIFDQLNWKMALSGKEERFRLQDAKWGALPDGHGVGTPVPLFPRIDS